MLSKILKKQVIRNGAAPVCKNCVYYIPNKERNYIRCMKYGNKDVVTGEVEFDYAFYARSKPDMCGLEGRSFQLESS